MSQQYAWRVLVTDSQGDLIPTDDTTFTNPYISDETAQQVAERIASSVGPEHLSEDPTTKEITVQVWHRPEATGDPIASARWSAPGAH
jgi:hypothetical protein